MQQYLELLQTIKEKGAYKAPARENMPGTTSLFGYQFRHNLQDGFPLLTTKKMYWKGVVVELLWFLRGDTNIKYLVDNDVRIWNEDAYNYYLKKCKEWESMPKTTVGKNHSLNPLSFEQFIIEIKEGRENIFHTGYKLGDCGFQYGKVWRRWEGYSLDSNIGHIRDQIKNVIESIKSNPTGRRHIVTAIDPAHENDLALYWCHAMFQFNCRLLTDKERYDWTYNKIKKSGRQDILNYTQPDKEGCPKYYLDCQLYQRSADVFLGVPFNIASYALLTEIIAKICNMIPGEFIHTFGDVHIYDNHKEAVEEQLKRTPTELPRLELEVEDDFEYLILEGGLDYNYLMKKLVNYNPQPAIKAELSTGLKK